MFVQDLRRRLRYLSHLPLTCEFVMAELDLRPPIVSQHVLDTFKGIRFNTLDSRVVLSVQ